MLVRYATLTTEIESLNAKRRQLPLLVLLTPRDADTNTQIHGPPHFAQQNTKNTRTPRRSPTRRTSRRATATTRTPSGRALRPAAAAAAAATTTSAPSATTAAATPVRCRAAARGHPSAPDRAREAAAVAAGLWEGRRGTGGRGSGAPRPTRRARGGHAEGRGRRGPRPSAA